MDDYITGVEQVGADPTVTVETVAPVETVVPVDTKEKAAPAPDVHEFKQYDLEAYDTKDFEKPYDYGDYGDFGHTDAKPTAYEEDFGPGVPAETDFRESNVSGPAVRTCRWVAQRSRNVKMLTVESLMCRFCVTPVVYYFWSWRSRVFGSETNTPGSKTHTLSLLVWCR